MMITTVFHQIIMIEYILTDSVVYYFLFSNIFPIHYNIFLLMSMSNFVQNIKNVRHSR